MAKRNQNKKRISPNVQNILEGQELLSQHVLFGQLHYYSNIVEFDKNVEGKAYITFRNYVVYNKRIRLSPEQWACDCSPSVTFGIGTC